MKTLVFAAVMACADPAWAATEWVCGKVIGIDPARSRITLEHAPIRIVKMAAMTMPFTVGDASLLEPFKVGDRVRFEVLERDNELIVQRIEARR